MRPGRPMLMPWLPAAIRSMPWAYLGREDKKSGALVPPCPHSYEDTPSHDATRRIIAGWQYGYSGPDAL